MVDARQQLIIASVVYPPSATSSERIDASSAVQASAIYYCDTQVTPESARERQEATVEL